MIANLMPHTVNVKRPTPTPDSSGGESDLFATVYSSLPAFVQPTAATWKVYYAQRQIEVTHSVYVNKTVTVRKGDQVVYGTRTFLVQGVRNLLELNKVTQIDVLEVT